MLTDSETLVLASGTATGGIVIPIIAQQLLPRIGFPWTIRVLGFVVLFNASIAQVFARERNVRKVSGPLFDLKAFRDVRYSMFSAALFMIFCSLYVGFFYVSSCIAPHATCPDVFLPRLVLSLEMQSISLYLLPEPS